MDEAEFRRGIRDRLPVAWERLARLYGEALLRRARLILPPGMDPENAVGDVWLRALQGASRYDPGSPPFPWLARICANTCLNQRRGILRLLQRIVSGRLPDGPRGARARGAAETRGSVREALRGIARREREVVTLRFLFEISLAEIAVLLGVQPNSVSQTLLRGLEHLRTGPMAETLRAEMARFDEGGV